MLLYSLASSPAGDFFTKQLQIGPKFGLPYYAVLIIIVALAALIALFIVLAAKAAKKGRRVKQPKDETIDVRSSEPAESQPVEKKVEKKEETSEEEVIRNNSELRSGYVVVSGSSEETEEEIEESAEGPVYEEKPIEEISAVTEEAQPEEATAEEVAEEPVAEEIKEEPEVAEEAEEEPEAETVEQAEEQQPEEQTIKAKGEEEQKETVETEEKTPEEVIEEQKEETVQEKEVVATESEEIAPVAEKTSEETEMKKTEEKKAAPKATKAATATKAAPKTEKKAPAKTPAKAPAKPAAKPAAKPTAAKADTKPVAKADAKSSVVGKIEICNSDLGGYNYLLKANNGQLLYESKAYKSIDSTKEAIQNFVEAVKVGMFSVRVDKFKNYKFLLKSPTSNNLLYVGESFTTESSCKSNIESVKKFAANSPIVDITEKDFVAKFVSYEIPAQLVKDVEKGNLSTGKWNIERTDDTVKNSPFEFLLYANNGQLLYESRDYKSYSTCLSGLKTFVNTVKTGYFVIDPDKSGRFKFVLRNKSASSVTEYYGQNYDTKKACANNIDSVYHFALLSPIPEN